MLTDRSERNELKWDKLWVKVPLVHHLMEESALNQCSNICWEWFVSARVRPTHLFKLMREKSDSSSSLTPEGRQGGISFILICCRFSYLFLSVLFQTSLVCVLHDRVSSFRSVAPVFSLSYQNQRTSDTENQREKIFFPPGLWRTSHVAGFHICSRLPADTFEPCREYPQFGVGPKIKLILTKLIKETENSHIPHIGRSLSYLAIFTITVPSI